MAPPMMSWMVKVLGGGDAWAAKAAKAPGEVRTAAGDEATAFTLTLVTVVGDDSSMVSVTLAHFFAAGEGDEGGGSSKTVGVDVAAMTLPMCERGRFAAGGSRCVGRRFALRLESTMGAAFHFVSDVGARVTVVFLAFFLRLPSSFSRTLFFCHPPATAFF